jgi:signal peptidase I
MSSRPVTRILGGLAGLAALALAWLLLAPPALGGKTSIVITSGNSMEPKLHQGDLVIVRQRPSYGVGDVVLFRSSTLGRDVLHRIVAVEDGRFATMGDNNDHRDPGRVSPGEVHGEAVLLVPGAGKPVAWLRHPLNAAIALFVLVFLSLAGGREVARRRPRPAVRPLQPVTSAVLPTAFVSQGVVAAARTVLVAGAVALALFALLAVIAWRSPGTTAQTVGQAYEHTGSFSYSAKVRPSAVYPDGRVSTGDTAFTRLVRRLDIAFDYRFDTGRRHDVRGGIALDAVISDGAGWSRTIPIDSAVPFDGDTARAEGVLDLRRLETLGARMRALTGTGASTFTVTLRPQVQIAGYAGEAVVDETFAPELRLVLDPYSLRPDTGDDLRSTLAPRQPGGVVEERENRIGIGALAVPVADARAFSGLGIGIALLVLIGAAALLSRRVDGSEDERIEARYAGRIVPAATAIPESRWVTDVADMESLVRLADHYDRVVLRTSEGAHHAYLVDDGVAVYRYRAGSGTEGARAPGTSPLPGRS